VNDNLEEPSVFNIFAPSSPDFGDGPSPQPLSFPVSHVHPRSPAAAILQTFWRAGGIIRPRVGRPGKK
jgi:hypothetical protein